MEEEKPALADVLKELRTQPVSTDILGTFRKKTNEKFHTINGYTFAQIEAMAKEYLFDFFDENECPINLVDVLLYGSRSRGIERPDSDIDIVFEYEGNGIKEYEVFNMLNDSPFCIAGIRVDFNPITKGESGTLIEYLPRAERYLTEEKILYHSR